LGKSRVTRRIQDLNEQLKAGLSAMPRITLHTPVSRELSAGIVCFEVAGMPPDQVVTELRRRGIVASVTPYRTQYARMAPSLLNSPAEIETVLKEIHDLSS